VTRSLVRAAPLVAIVLLLTACGSTDSAVRKATRGASQLASCGATVLHRGSPPPWTASAWASSSGPPSSLPYGTTARANAAAFIFGYPLRAGDPSNPANKILWIVRLPRNGSNLVIRARPLREAKPVVTVTRTADSSPGQIYPSIVNVPRAGCWRLTLHWAGHSDALDLLWAA
jgi:hypothetical protein